MQIFSGTIITCDQDNNVFNYLVEDKGRILYVGQDLPEKFTPFRQIELGERALIPAFGDGHLHFSNWALIADAFFDVREAYNFADMGLMIKDFASKDKKAKVLTAFGASRHHVKEQRLITRAELDEILPDRPLYIICYDGHSAIGNSKLLETLPEEIKKTRGFKEESGHILHDAFYKATDHVTSAVPPLELIRGIINGYDRLAANGNGLIHATEGIGFPRDMDVSLVSLIARARTKKNGFQTRLFFQTMEIDKVQKKKLPRIGGCFATALDGCFGVCDAALNEPYSHEQDNKGILFYSDQEVIDFVKQAHRQGLQIELHTIGDAAVDQAIKAFKAALEESPREDHRHSLIHACLISPENISTCADLGLGITVQPGFLISPLEPEKYLEEILGSRVKTSSPLRTILDKGIHLSGGSDAPVTPPDPITGIYGACNHPYDADQSLTIQEALKMFTYETAWMSFDEKERGSLELGKMADMVILNTNPLQLAPENLKDLKVESLYLRGEKYRSGMSLMSLVWNSILGRNLKI